MVDNMKFIVYNVQGKEIGKEIGCVSRTAMNGGLVT
jgi:hypothetical protein